MNRQQALRAQEAARKVFQAVDDVWSAELQHQFGSKAGDVRYTPQGRGQAGSEQAKERLLHALHYAREEARVAWHEAVDFAREFSEQ